MSPAVPPLLSSPLLPTPTQPLLQFLPLPAHSCLAILFSFLPSCLFFHNFLTNNSISSPTPSSHLLLCPPPPPLFLLLLLTRCHSEVCCHHLLALPLPPPPPPHKQFKVTPDVDPRCFGRLIDFRPHRNPAAVFVSRWQMSLSHLLPLVCAHT